MPVLTSEEHDAILRAAAPLAPANRKPFIADVVAALRHELVIGPGTVHRAIVAAQRAHFDPPRYATAMSAPRPRSR